VVILLAYHQVGLDSWFCVPVETWLDISRSL
jgi:hypothetical protein